jgi:flavin reductase (DIM6/NTAB) family NADH-FMN oxidoreductase RutF
MDKIELSSIVGNKGMINPLRPLLPVWVGANVNGQPNYITIALVGWLCYDAISISIGHKQYTNMGIRENGAFSINLPSAKMVEQLDCCGMVSGSKADKSALFDNFYGKLKTAPMIRECPINIECRVEQIMERNIHTVFIGEIVEAYIDEACMTDSAPDLAKIDPILFSPGGANYFGAYWKLGEKLADAMNVGKTLKKTLNDA